MYSISKDFEFSAAHQLSGLPDDHPCSRLHGHNYIVRVLLRSSELNDVGFVLDYRELDSFKNDVIAELDHRNLNDIVPFSPTSERLARWLYHQLLEHYGVSIAAHQGNVMIGVSETPKTWAFYDESDTNVGA